MKDRRTQIFTASILACLALAAAAPLAAAEVQVRVLNNVFTPDPVTIQPGDTVTWTNNSGHHNVLSSNGVFSSGEPDFGWTFSHTFTSPGTFSYICQPHAIFGMRGQVIVKAGPAAPTGLSAAARSVSEVVLDWTDRSNNETGFRIERKGLGGAFQEVGSVGAGVTTFVAGGLAPATFYTFRVRATGAGGAFSGFSNEAGAATDAPIAPCAADADTLCVNDDRFRVGVAWRTGNGNGAGQAVPIASAPDSGLFYFFDASNLEMLVKVLNACGLNERYWLFYAATTNVELTLTVTDIRTGKVKVYFNPLNNPAAPVQDTDAFATCP